MKRWLLVLCLCWPSVVWADVTVIYRKADSVVCGWATTPQAVPTELTNCTRSELGGGEDDYATATVSDQAWRARGNQDVTITPAGKVRFVPNPVEAKRQEDRASAKTKLRGLGLTDEEIDALR